MIRNPAKHLDYANKKALDTRYHAVPANAIEQAARAQGEVTP